MVVVNSNLWMKTNNQVDGLADPAGQLAWLTQVLSDAETQGEKVWYHIPIIKYINWIYQIALSNTDKIHNTFTEMTCGICNISVKTFHTNLHMSVMANVNT